MKGSKVLRNGISASVIKRLPRYYRLLGELAKSGYVKISSKELASYLRSTASQIRQDLNCFGGFGQQGYGYNVESLRQEIGEILGVNKKQPAIIIGMGNLGRALALHIDFSERGCELIGLFDSNPELTGVMVGDMAIRCYTEIEKFCSERKPSIAVLCVPKDSAKDIADKLVSLGIKGFWNFSHYDLIGAYEGVSVENVHIGDTLLRLNYAMNKQETANDDE